MSDDEESHAPPRYLYHGTSAGAARKALVEGIKPRRLTKRSNWDEYPSREDLVYLSETYAPFYALSTREDVEVAKNRLVSPRTLAIIEVDLYALDPSKLRPDEDAVEQITRGVKDFSQVEDPQVRSVLSKMPPVDMKVRTKYVQENLDRIHGLWMASLKWLGTCSYRGTIPATAIRRVSFFDPSSNGYIVMASLDPSITPLNFALMAGHYRALTRWFFEPITSKDMRDAGDLYFLGLGPEEYAKRERAIDEELAKREGVEVVVNRRSTP